MTRRQIKRCKNFRHERPEGRRAEGIRQVNARRQELQVNQLKDSKAIFEISSYWAAARCMLDLKTSYALY
jgi:hypothetical protein